MTAEPPTEYHPKFLSLTEGCTGSSESKLVKMPHCWKSRDAAHMQNSYVVKLGDITGIINVLLCVCEQRML